MGQSVQEATEQWHENMFRYKFQKGCQNKTSRMRRSSCTGSIFYNSSFCRRELNYTVIWNVSATTAYIASGRHSKLPTVQWMPVQWVILLCKALCCHVCQTPCFQQRQWLHLISDVHRFTDKERSRCFPARQFEPYWMCFQWESNNEWVMQKTFCPIRLQGMLWHVFLMCVMW